jgi:hypothetical protein
MIPLPEAVGRLALSLARLHPLTTSAKTQKATNAFALFSRDPKGSAFCLSKNQSNREGAKSAKKISHRWGADGHR